MRLGRVGALLGTVLIACGASSAAGAAPRSPDGSTPTATAPVPDAPPPVVVRAGARRPLLLHPYTYCWNRGCADGFLRHPQSVGRSNRVVVRTVPNATIHVGFQAPAWPRQDTPLMTERCGRRFSTTARADAQGRATLTPVGPADTYGVDLFVNPPSGGDLIVGFNWTTTRAGPTNAPRSEASILAEHDGAVDSYGVELGASNLLLTPAVASATIRITAANGASTTIVLGRSTDDCTEGSVAFMAPRAAGVSAARLGPKPFIYDVTLVLDGVAHSAHAVWPRDVDRECSPCVPLRYRPRLPRLAVG